MKKLLKKTALYTVLVCVFSLVACSQSFGQTLSTQAGGAGTLVTVTKNTGDGPNLTYSPSPNVWMMISSDSINYAIQAMNANIADGFRNEYGIWNGNSGYSQAVNGNMAVPANGVVLTDFTVALTSGMDLITASPYSGGTWVAIGGGT